MDSLDTMLTRKERRLQREVEENSFTDNSTSAPETAPEVSPDPVDHIDAEIERLRAAASGNTMTTLELEATIYLLKNVPVEKELLLTEILQERRNLDAAKAKALRAEEERLAAQKAEETERLTRRNSRIVKVRRLLKVVALVSTLVAGACALAVVVLGWG